MSFDEVARQAGAKARGVGERSTESVDDVMRKARARRRRSAVTVALAVAVLAVVTVRSLPGGTRVEFAPSSPSAGDCATAAAVDGDSTPAWTRLPAPPLRLTDSFDVVGVPPAGVAVITGSESDNAALLDAGSGTWTCLPDSPLEAGEGGVSAVFAAGRIVVWNGDAVAAYNAADGEWTDPTASPEMEADPLAMVAVQDEVLVWWRGSDGRTPGAAWNVLSGRWAPMTDAPIAFEEASAVWSGEVTYLVGASPTLVGPDPARTPEAVVYDRATDSWTILEPPPTSPWGWSATWMDDRLVVWDYELNAAVLDGTAWMTLPSLPLRFRECFPSSAVIRDQDRVYGDMLFAFYCSQAALWDGGSWMQVAVPDGVIGDAVAAGERTVVVAAETPNFPASAWLFDSSAVELIPHDEATEPAATEPAATETPDPVVIESPEPATEPAASAVRELLAYAEAVMDGEAVPRPDLFSPEVVLDVYAGAEFEAVRARRDELVDREAWQHEWLDFAEMLARVSREEEHRVVVGPVGYCAAGRALPDPAGYEDHEHVVIEATGDIFSCLQWSAFDVYLADDGRIAAIRAQLWE